MKKNGIFAQISLIVMVLCVAALAFPENAHAGYLDPGSGSTLMQGIVAIAACIRRFFMRIAAVFGGKKGA